MQKWYHVINYKRTNLDFNIVQYGFRQCEPLFGEKPNVWKDYLIHYVYSGQGTLYADGKKFPVHEKQAFLIFPGQVATYIADRDDPFFYGWVEFYGNAVRELIPSAGLSAENPVFDDKNGAAGKALEKILHGGEMTPAGLTSAFWAFADALSVKNPYVLSSTERYLQDAVYFIQANINRSITVDDVCRHLHISRNYLTRIFTQELHISPKKYIMNSRMEVAKTFLKKTDFRIGEISSLIGYEKPSDFTKAFIRAAGISPSAFRKTK